VGWFGQIGTLLLTGLAWIAALTAGGNITLGRRVHGDISGVPGVDVAANLKCESGPRKSSPLIETHDGNIGALVRIV
jgi:hypothetical protein